MRSKSIKKIIRKLSSKIICLNDSKYIKFKKLSILIGIYIFIILSTVSDVGAATVGKTITGAPTDPLRNGLVGHWTFDGKNMISNVADSSVSGNNGKMFGFTSTSTAVRAGLSGQALIFDGVNDSVDLTSTASQNNPMTSCAWVNPKNLSTMSSGYGGGILRSFTNTNGAAGDFWYGVTNSGYIKFSYYKSLADTTGLISYNGQNPVLTANKWYHVCVSWDGSAQSVYINSIKQTSAVTTTNAGGGWGTGAYIGKIYASGAYQFNGSIDDVRLYNRLLSDSEIKQIYSQGSAKVASTISRPAQTGLSSGLVGHWTFDGKNMISNVADSSGQGNNGMMSGFTSTSSAVTAGKVGQGLRFDGVDDIINIGSASSLNLSNNYSINFWIYPQPNFAGTIIRQSSNVSNTTMYSKYDIRVTTAGVGFRTGNGTIGDDDDGFNVAIDPYKWTMITCTLSSSNLKSCYKNGVLINTATNDVDTSLITPIVGLIGTNRNSAGNNFYEGALDDLRVYNRELSTSEIKQLYNQSAGTKVATTMSRPAQTGLSSGLVGHWTFDGKNMISNVADSSGQGNNGMMSGFTSTSSAVTAGKVGQGLRFDGVDDMISAGSASSLDNLSAMTISVWTKPSSFGESGLGFILQKSDGYSYSGWELGNQITYQGVKFNVNYGGGSTDDLTVISNSLSSSDFNKWTNWIITWDGTSAGTGVHIYKNGIETSYGLRRDGTGSRANDASSNLIIGNNTGQGRTYHGALEDLRLYNRVLSASEVQQLYNIGK